MMMMRFISTYHRCVYIIILIHVYVNMRMYIYIYIYIYIPKHVGYKHNS